MEVEVAVFLRFVNNLVHMSSIRGNCAALMHRDNIRNSFLGNKTYPHAYIHIICYNSMHAAQVNDQRSTIKGTELWEPTKQVKSRYR